VEVKPITGGITNMLYRVGPRDVEELSDDVPYPPVLARVFGEAGDAVCDRIAENKITAELGKIGFGPRVHAEFGNGRLEQWLIGRRPLEPLELVQVEPVDLVSLNARRLAEMHEIPSISSNLELWSQLREWIAMAEKVAFPGSEAKAKQLASIPVPRFAEEINAMEELTPSAKNDEGAALLAKATTAAERRAREILYEKRFCHMDLLSGNIMFSEKKKDVIFIDYEYGMTSYIGLDIANHFNAVPESCLILENTFDVDKYYPKTPIQRKFLVAYCEARKIEINEEVLTAMQAVIQEFTMLAEQRWVIWGIVQAGTSPVDFDYLDYTKMRFEKGYLRYKELYESKILL